MSDIKELRPQGNDDYRRGLKDGLRDMQAKSRRFQAACAAMQAYLSDMRNACHLTHTELAAEAVKCADALLAALEGETK